MTTIHIPPAALEAGAIALAQEHGWPVETFDKLEPELRDDLLRPYIKRARAAFVAMVEAWEGMHMEDESAPWVPRLILPLAAPSGAITEKPDDKA